MGFHPFPNDKYLDWSKFKAFADDKINVTLTQLFFLGLVENGGKYWFLFPGRLKLGFCGKELTHYKTTKFQTGPY